MRTTLIALSAAAVYGIAGFAAAPASAAPVAPAHLAAQNAGNHIENVHYVPRHVRRHVRRHFWAPGPWAFHGLGYRNCFPVRHGFVCYY
jgi:hypothetical protein